VHAVAIPGPLFLAGSADRPSWPSAFVPFPLRDDAAIKRTPPLVRVRLSVQFRVHSRQMLCVGGSAIPLGWSFLSIAKVPMSWTPDDIWVVDIELPAGTRIEYKYVVLEEQDWTQQVNQAAEGRVEYSYRVSPDENPPDVRRITKQMAIVAWQAGPNRILQVPSEAELAELRRGGAVQRGPISISADAIAPGPPSGTSPPTLGAVSGASAATTGTQRLYGQQALGPAAFPPAPGASVPPRPEELAGIWEVLSLDEGGKPYLERRDVWGQGSSPNP
jgi:hypothetical protein